MHRTYTLIVLLVCLWLPSRAQYHLQEVGFRSDAGPQLATGTVFKNYLPTGGSSPFRKLGAQARFSGFYSHYFCGKAYGYHLEGTLGATHWNEGVPGDTRIPLSAQPAQTLPHAQVGAFFKVRKHNYHRSKEVFALLGFRTGWQTGGTAVLQFPAWVISPEASIWGRLPRGKSHAWLVGAGGNFYFNALSWADTATMESGTTSWSIHPWVSLGTTLWSNR